MTEPLTPSAPSPFAPPLHDTDWLERMYNNRALVPDHPDYFARWAQESAEARVHSSCVLDVPYVAAGSAELGATLDIFPPARAQAALTPVLVFIHGGYWRSLDKADHSFVALPFTQEGYCVVIVNYALCPGTPDAPVDIPHIVRQMDSALCWVAQNIAAYGGDAQRITVVGHSAGGHLATLLLTRPWPLIDKALPAGLVRNAMSISGVHDLEPLRHIPSLQPALHLTEKQVLEVSPARLPQPAQGVLYCAVGADESPEFIRQSHLMQQTWGNSLVPCSDELPGLNHFSVVEAFAQPGHALHQMALQLLRA